MSDEDKNNEKDMEILTRAIVDAITKSRDVREAMRRLTESDEVCAKSFMVLMLKVRSLAETMGLDFPSSCSHDPEKSPPVKEKKKADSRQDSFKKLMACYVDGKQLTPREMEFCEYLATKFDSDEWLKKHGLII